MQSLEKIDAYVSAICNQIRWKKARPRVADEIRNHIIDQRNSFIEQGFDQDLSTDKAIAETGDAAEIGLQLDHTHRPKPQWSMLAATIALFIVGYFIQLIIFNGPIKILPTVIGLSLMAGAYFLDFTLIGKYPKVTFLAIITVTIIVINKSPVYAPYFTLLFPLAFVSVVFALRGKKYAGMLICGLTFVLLAVIAFSINFKAGFIIYVITSIVVLGAAVSKKWFSISKIKGFLLIIFPVVITLIILLLNMTAYQWARITAIYNQPLYSFGMGNVIRELLSGAKLLGAGNVPEKYISFFSFRSSFKSDYILTSVIVKMGWASFAAILSVFIFFIFKGFHLCIKQKTGLGLFVSVSIMLIFSLQVIGYLAFNFGFYILSPLSLPLISFGDSAMVMNMGLIGFMLSVFRTGNIVDDSKIANKRNKFFSWQAKKEVV